MYFQTQATKEVELPGGVWCPNNAGHGALHGEDFSVTTVSRRVDSQNTKVVQVSRLGHSGWKSNLSLTCCKKGEHCHAHLPRAKNTVLRRALGVQAVLLASRYAGVVVVVYSRTRHRRHNASIRAHNKIQCTQGDTTMALLAPCNCSSTRRSSSGTRRQGQLQHEDR